MGQYLLEMRDICKSFPGVRALDHVSLAIRPGSIHSLMGENGAGKSTLMKCLFGIYHEDSGEILLEGRPVKFQHPRQAMAGGIAMVHQELNQVHTRNVMENIWLGRFPKGPLGLIDHKKMYADTLRIFEDLNIRLNPRAVISSLSVSQRQMVEIAKAVSLQAKVVVFDEPTSSLTKDEVEHLFRIIFTLRDRGCGIIYISHRMDEILRISDEVTILRDGQRIATSPAKELTTNRIITQMVGRELTNVYPPKTNTPGEVVLEVQGLSSLYQNLQDVSFTLRRGEILGVAGLVGAGRTELLENLFGLAVLKCGRVLKNGVEIVNRSAGQTQRFRHAHRGEARHRHFRRAEYPGEHRHRQPGQLSDKGTLLESPENGAGHRLGDPNHADQDARSICPDQFPFRRQPTKGHHRALAFDPAGYPAVGRADPRHRRGRQV